MAHAKILCPLLQPAHFHGLDTQLDDSGLNLTLRVDHSVRENECVNLGKTFDEGELILRRIASLRPFSTVVINPLFPTASELKEVLQSAQQKLRRKEHINVAYGLPESYDQHWRRQEVNGFDSERQALVFVIYRGNRFAGYASIDVSLIHDVDSKEEVLTFSLDLIYVAPEYRKQGLGLDLSAACGLACCDVLNATYRAVKSGSAIRVVVEADYESEGGETFTEHIRDSLDVAVDILMERGKRRNISLSQVELDSGY
jgi:GNAT superfamily N-acetyltransferase